MTDHRSFLRDLNKRVDEFNKRVDKLEREMRRVGATTKPGDRKMGICLRRMHHDAAVGYEPAAAYAVSSAAYAPIWTFFVEYAAGVENPDSDAIVRLESGDDPPLWLWRGQVWVDDSDLILAVDSFRDLPRMMVDIVWLLTAPVRYAARRLGGLP